MDEKEIIMLLKKKDPKIIVFPNASLETLQQMERQLKKMGVKNCLVVNHTPQIFYPELK